MTKQTEKKPKQKHKKHMDTETHTHTHRKPIRDKIGNCTYKQKICKGKNASTKNCKKKK